MLQLALAGGRRVEIREAALPELRDGEVLIRVEAAGICAEARRFAAGETAESCGHEAVGTVVAGALATGTRVAAMPLYGCGACGHCRSGAYIHCAAAFSEPEAGMAQYLRKPAFLCPSIPDEVSWERALLTCCALGPGFGALERTAPGPGETVLVAGAGPVGLGATVAAHGRGLDVVVAEPAAERRERAEGLGARTVDATAEDAAAQARALAGEAGIAAAVECSGSAAGARLCIDAVRTFGSVAFVGVGPRIEVDRWDDTIRRGVTLTGAWHYNLNAFPRVLALARTLDAGRLVAESYAFAEAQQAFEAAAAGTAKVILRPQEA